MSSALTTQPPRISFEFFAPKGADAMGALCETMARLAPYRPEFISVTDGAGGGTDPQTAAKATLNALKRLRGVALGAPMLGHLTIAGRSQADCVRIAAAYGQAGAEGVVALRGDSPRPSALRDAEELTALLSDRTDRRLFVACYPETHPKAASPDADIDALKAKIDAGAEGAITQYFFENDDYFRFLDRCRAAGITAPIIPGLMPIHDFAAVARFSARCGASIPARMADRFAKAKACGAEHELAASYLAGQCAGLVEQGVRQLHFYTLNRWTLTEAALKALGVPRLSVSALSGDHITAHRAAS